MLLEEEQQQQLLLLSHLNGETLLNICQFFTDLSSLFSLRLTCNIIHNEITNIEEDFYKHYIQHTLPFHFSKLFNSNLHHQHLHEGSSLFSVDLKNCRKLVKDLIVSPFVNQCYDETDSDFKKYLGLGGVVRVTIFQPCELLQHWMRILHNRNNSTIESFSKIHRVPFHKFLLIASIFPVLDCNGIEIKKSTTIMEECNNELNDYHDDLKEVSPGKLLLWMCNRPIHPNDELDGSSDEEEIYMDGEYVSSSSSESDEDEYFESSNDIENNLKYNPPYEIHFKLKDAERNLYGEKSLKYHLISNKPHEEREEDYKMCDIFTFCSRPPSSNYVRKGNEKNFESIVKKLRSYLYNDDYNNIYTLDWSGTISRNRFVLNSFLNQ